MIGGITADAEPSFHAIPLRCRDFDIKKIIFLNIFVVFETVGEVACHPAQIRLMQRAELCVARCFQDNICSSGFICRLIGGAVELVTQ